jgi:hypothetical protein
MTAMMISSLDLGSDDNGKKFYASFEESIWGICSICKYRNAMLSVS